jgi:signal transduction histidine kinase
LQGEVRTLRAEQARQGEVLARRGDVGGELLATVAHELRTPLTSLRSSLGLLTGGLGHSEARAQDLLRIALSNSERLIRLVNSILDLEYLESGHAPLQLRRCDLSQLARDAADSMAPLAEAAGVHLQVAPALTFLAFPMQADGDRILQVLTNLLSNAIKFSAVGDSVAIDARAASGALLLTVSDQGRGVPASQLESIFDRFYQVEAEDARRQGGVGLGLAICRSIVEQHGGSIWASANSGPGTTFSLRLPLPAEEAAGLAAEPELAAALA